MKLVQRDGERWIDSEVRPPHLTHRWLSPEDPDRLTEFAMLHEYGEEVCVQFAEKNGLLGLCADHYLPIGHSGCTAVLSHTEPLAVWYSLSERSSYLLECAGRANFKYDLWQSRWKRYRNPTFEYEGLWDELDPGIDVDESSKTRDQELAKIAAVANQWLVLGGVRLNLAWRKKWTLQTGGHSLFSFLCAQIVRSTVAGDVYVCFSCGNVYVRSRRPRKNARHYCQTCVKKGIPARDRKREQRQRQQRA